MTTRRAFSHWLIALGFIAAALLPAACAPPQEEPTPTPVPRPAVAIKPTYEVARGDIVLQFQFVGRISPILEQELFFRTGGNVRSVQTVEDESVAAGQLLADLEIIDDLDRQKTLDELAVRRAEERVEIARLQLALVESGEPSAARDIEVAIKQHEVTLAEIALEEARLNVRDLGEAVAAAQLVGPFDGQVLSMSISEGDAVEAFAPVMVVADLSALEVSADLRRSDIENLIEGMPAVIAPVNRPGQTISGYIRRLPYQSASGSLTAVESDDPTVRIALDTPPDEAGLELRERVQVTVVLEHREDALWLPPQAIRTFEGRQFVVVQDGNAQQRVDVTLGLRTSERVEIVEGLTEGQTVVGP